MKKIFQLSALALALLATACSKPDVDIVEQNMSYSLDPKATAVDFPEKVTYDPSNFIRREGRNIEPMIVYVEDGTTIIEPEEIELSFTIRKPLTKDTKIKLVEDASLLESYTDSRVGLLPLPENMFTTLEATIPAGATSFTMKLLVQPEVSLPNKSGYLTAYRLTILDGGDDLKVLKGSEALYIRVYNSEEEE